MRIPDDKRSLKVKDNNLPEQDFKKGGSSNREITVEASARRRGGGPRLAFEEWIAVISIYRTCGGDTTRLADALAHASERLRAFAAANGSARAGTQLRSARGLRRRLTVLRALEAGDTSRLPAGARAAWELFASQTEKATEIAEQVLGPTTWPSTTRNRNPSRGPAPRSGLVMSNHEDGENRVYVMRLVGPVAKLLYGGTGSMVSVKIGRSADPQRRLTELNSGLPPGCGLEWHLECQRCFPSAAGAHAFEQGLLTQLYRDGFTVGREFARIASDQVAGLLQTDLNEIRTTKPTFNTST